MTRFLAITVFGLLSLAILPFAPSPAAAEYRFEATNSSSASRRPAGSFVIAQKAPLTEAEKRKRQRKKQAEQARKRQQQQKRKAEQARKLQQQQKRKAEQARKRQQQQRRKAEQARKRQQQQERKAQQARKLQQQQKRKAEQARKVRQIQEKKAQQARQRQQLQTQKAQQVRQRQQQRAKAQQVRQREKLLERNARRRTVERRRVQHRRHVRRNQQQYRKLQRRRASLQRQIKRNRVRNRDRAVRLKRQNARLRRQRAWLSAQNNVYRRRGAYQNFAFHERARVLERRRDRTVYAALAGAAVGAAIVGSYYVFHNDDNRIDWRARDVYVDDLDNGWTRNIVIRPDGTRIVTIRDGGGFIVRRYRVYPGNRVVMIYDNQPRWWHEDDLVVDVRPVRYTGPRGRYIVEPSSADIDTVYDTIVADPVDEIDRTYTLNQILVNANLRAYMPRIDIDTITFRTGSSEIPEYQLDRLDEIGAAMEEAINENPNEVYLIEGHTDATGSEIGNLMLSDERAAAVANALTDYYDIPPENLVTQGYGEQFLKVDTLGPNARNRRVAIRRVTPLLANETYDIELDEEGNEVFAQY